MSFGSVFAGKWGKRMINFFDDVLCIVYRV